jgi:hypothetical protein
MSMPTEPSYSEAFLDRLSAIVHRIDAEDMPPDDDLDGEAEDDEDIAEAHQNEGGDIDAAEKEMAELRRRHWLAFVGIVDHLAQRYHLGPIDQLPDDRLERIARDAVECADAWDAEVDMENRTIEAPTPLQELLKLHHDIGLNILNIEDEALAARIAR